jgi:hypothetical protein
MLPINYGVHRDRSLVWDALCAVGVFTRIFGMSLCGEVSK